MSIEEQLRERAGQMARGEIFEDGYDLEVRAADSLDDLTRALIDIREFTRGYGDIALVVHRMADRALRDATQASDAGESNGR